MREVQILMVHLLDAKLVALMVDQMAQCSEQKMADLSVDLLVDWKGVDWVGM